MKPAVLRWCTVLAAAVGCVALVFVMDVPQAYSAWFARQAEIRELQRKNTELERKNTEKRDRIRELEDNAALQELEIREKNKKLRKGEQLFILQDQETPAKPQ